MTPAAYVIEKFGGIRPLARAIGRDPSSVQLWKIPHTRGGGGGAIPSKAQTAIIAASRKLGIQIDPAKLVRMPR